MRFRSVGTIEIECILNELPRRSCALRVHEIYYLQLHYGLLNYGKVNNSKCDSKLRAGHNAVIISNKQIWR